MHNYYNCPKVGSRRAFFAPLDTNLAGKSPAAAMITKPFVA